MHDLDRTLQTLEPEGEYETGEYELAPEIFGNGATAHGELSPAAELELAGELSEVTNEGELEQFLSRYYRHYPRLRNRGRYRMRRFFRRYLYGGRYGGGYGAGYGGYAGGQEPEPAPPPPPVPVVPAVVEAVPDPVDGGEEMEMECARRFVRLGGAMAKKLAAGPAEGEPESPQPGAGGACGGATCQGSLPQTGRWVRHHGKIVLLGT